MHIIFLILKIIGFILLFILCLLLLILCLILFMPIHYDVAAKSTKDLSTLKAKGRVTWLFRAIQGDVYYSDYTLKWRVRIFWKKIMGGQSFADETDEAEGENTGDVIDQLSEEDLDAILDAELAKKAEGQTQKDGAAEKTGAESTENGTEESSEESSEGSSGTESTEVQIEKSTVENGDKDFSSNEDSGTSVHPADFSNNLAGSKPGNERKTDFSNEKEEQGIDAKIRDIENKVEKIKCTCTHIYDKINELIEKFELVYDFLTNEGHIHTILKLKKWIFKLLKKILPKKYILEGEYGFEDPQITGTVLAIYSALRPHLNKHADLRYNFDRSVLKGRISANRNIYVYPFVLAALSIILDRKCRQSYKDVKVFLDEI